MPTRSTGCGMCRRRKIRCDEKRPSCDRCKTHGVSCPGYRQPPPGQVEFKDQTAEIVLRLDSKKEASKRVSHGSAFSTSTFPFSSVKNSKGAKGHTTPDSAIGLSDGSSPVDFDSLMSDLFYSQLPPLDLLQEDGFATTHPDLEWLDSQRQLGNCPLDFSQAMALYATPQYLPSAQIEKQLIYSTFIDTYLPKGVAGKAGDAHFSFLQHLLTTPQLRPEVNNALDALSMVQVGSVYKDQNLIQGSLKAYSSSLNGLIRTLASGSKSGSSISDDYVLATITILATCEFYDEISQMGTGWSHHIDGSRQLLEARGPDSIRSTLSLMLFSNMRHGALSHAFLIRKGTFLGKKEWREVAKRVPFYERDRSSKFYDLALQVPALLERQDKLDDDGKGIKKEVLDELLEDVRTVEKGLREWWESFKGLMGTGAPYWLVSVDEFETFTTLVKDRTIDKGWVFPNFMIAYLVSCYWDTMHFLRTCVKQLHLRRYEFSRIEEVEGGGGQSWFPPPDEVVKEEELMEYVMNMIRCFPYFTEPSSSATGSIGIFLPLRTAALYCAQHGHWAVLKWLGDVRDHVFIKGMRPPAVKDRQPAGSTKLFVVTRPVSSLAAY